MQKLLTKIYKFNLLQYFKNPIDFAFVHNIPSIKNIGNNSLDDFYNLFSDFRNNYTSIRPNRTSETGMFANKLGKINLKKFFNKNILIILVVVIALSLVGYFLNNSVGNKPQNENLNQAEVKGVISESMINREFLFPLKNAEGEEISNIKFEIVDASLRDEVLVQGQKAYPTENKLFLILGVKITNELDQPIEMNTKDYARLVVNGNLDEQLAPEMHNDPVQIQAISTKKTRLGFSVDRGDTDFVLKVGEINGDKQDVILNLNN